MSKNRWIPAAVWDKSRKCLDNLLKIQCIKVPDVRYFFICLTPRFMIANYWTSGNFYNKCTFLDMLRFTIMDTCKFDLLVHLIFVRQNLILTILKNIKFGVSITFCLKILKNTKSVSSNIKCLWRTVFSPHIWLPTTKSFFPHSVPPWISSF